MIAPLRSEITKLTSTPTSTLITSLVGIGLIAGPVLLLAIVDRESVGSASQPVSIETMVEAFIVFAFALVIGGSKTSADIKNGMHAQAFLTESHRFAWLAAKMVVLVVYVVSIIVTGMMAAVVVVYAFGGGIDYTNITPVWITLLCTAALTAVACGFAALVRNQPVAIAVPLVWVLIIETAITTAAGSFSQLEPFTSVLLSTAYIDMVYENASIAAGLAVFAGWVVVVGGAGLAANQLRDVC